MADAPALEAIGARLAAARYAARLTQQQVADKIGLTRPSVANIEAGRQDVTLTGLLAFIRAVRAHPNLIIRPSDLYPVATAPEEP